MNILLTGASGVVGTALAERLKKAGHSVKLLSRSQQATDTILCDLALITDEVKKSITEFKPDVVIHAGWAGTENTERNDPKFAEINVNAGMKLLEIATEAGCRRWIGFGSQAEYSPDLNDPIKEDAPAQPGSNYGNAKLTLMQKQQEYAAKHGVDFVWLRLFACYGKNYRPTYIIPYLIALMRNGELPDLKTPHAVWDYLHAEDAAEGVLKVIETPHAQGVYNLASGKKVTVGEMALILAEVLKFDKREELAAKIKSNNSAATYRVADVTKFSHAFGWQPAISIEEGLRKQVAE